MWHTGTAEAVDRLSQRASRGTLSKLEINAAVCSSQNQIFVVYGYGGITLKNTREHKETKKIKIAAQWVTIRNTR